MIYTFIHAHEGLEGSTDSTKNVPKKRRNCCGFVYQTMRLYPFAQLQSHTITACELGRDAGKKSALLIK
jgi:hypothetical protein